MLFKERFPTLRWLTAEPYPLKPVTFTDYRIKGWDSGQSDSLVLSQPLSELCCPSQPVIRSSEGLLHLKGDLVPQNIITGPGQLVGERFERHHPVGLVFLALIKALHAWVVTDGEVRRFHQGPGQILVPILGVAATLAFALARLGTIHPPAIGRKLTHPCEAANNPRLHHE